MTIRQELWLRLKTEAQMTFAILKGLSKAALTIGLVGLAYIGSVRVLNFAIRAMDGPVWVWLLLWLATMVVFVLGLSAYLGKLTILSKKWPDLKQNRWLTRGVLLVIIIAVWTNFCLLIAASGVLSQKT